jgi:hypothetical protein
MIRRLSEYTPEIPSDEGNDIEESLSNQPENDPDD